MHEYEIQVGIIGAIVWVIRWAQKSKKISWFTLEANKLRVAISAGIAVFTGLGFAFSFDGYSVMQGGKIVILAPSLMAIATTLSHSSLGFLGQELGHTILSIRDNQYAIAGLLSSLQQTGILDSKGGLVGKSMPGRLAPLSPETTHAMAPVPGDVPTSANPNPNNK